jgi:O-antigen ligase
MLQSASTQFSAGPVRGLAGGSDLRVDREVRRAQRAAVQQDILLLVGGAAFSGAIVVTMALGAGQLTLLASLAAIAAGLVSPALGVVILAFMGPLKSPAIVPAPGFNALLVGAVLIGCVYRLPFDRPRLRVSLPLLLTLVFTLYIFAQQLPEMLGGWQGEFGHLVGFQFVQLLTCVGALIATGIVVQDKRPWPFVTALVISATLVGLLAIETFNHPIPVGPIAYLVELSNDTARTVGPFGNPNYLGQYLASAAALGIALLAVGPGRLPRIALIACVTVMAVGLATSLSRGGVVALFAGLMVLAFAKSRRVGIALVVVGLPVALLAYGALSDQRAVGSAPPGASGYEALNENTDGRLSVVLEGPSLFATSPIFGIGYGQYRFQNDQQLVAHNWYASVLAEEGLIGIVTWSLLLLTVAMALRSRPPNARIVGFAVFGTVVVGMLFLELPTSFQASTLPAIALAVVLAANWLPPAVRDAGAPEPSSTRPPSAIPVASGAL